MLRFIYSKMHDTNRTSKRVPGYLSKLLHLPSVNLFLPKPFHQDKTFFKLSNRYKRNLIEEYSCFSPDTMI